MKIFYTKNVPCAISLDWVKFVLPLMNMKDVHRDYFFIRFDLIPFLFDL